MIWFGWIVGLSAIVVGVVLWRHPSRYGPGFVRAISLIILLGGVYVIWASHLMAGHAVLTHALF